MKKKTNTWHTESPRSFTAKATLLPNIKRIQPAYALCVVADGKKLEALNIVPTSYLEEIKLSRGERLHKIEIKSLGIITTK